MTNDLNADAATTAIKAVLQAAGVELADVKVREFLTNSSS